MENSTLQWSKPRSGMVLGFGRSKGVFGEPRRMSGSFLEVLWAGDDATQGSVQQTSDLATTHSESQKSKRESSRLALLSTTLASQ